MLKLLTNTKIQLLILTLLTILSFSNIFQNQFVIDDNAFIKGWDLIKNFSNIPVLFTGETAPVGHEKVYRPIRGIFYTISYQLFKENPLGYHIQSILIHLLNSLLVYLIVRIIIQDIGSLKKSQARFIPFTCALIFGLHPIHTEAITYITASFDIMGVVFFFASFYFYLKKRLYLSLIFAGLAFFTYEMTLTLPALFVLYELTLGKLKSLNLKFKKAYAYFILAGLFIFIRVVLVGVTSRGDYLNNSFYTTLLTMIKVWVRYIQLLFFPINLSINQEIAAGIRSWVHPLADLSKIYSQSIFDIDVLTRLALLSGIVFVAIKSIKKHPIISFCIGWFFITLLPISYLIPQGPIMQERYLYIPSFGFILLLVYIIFTLKSKILKPYLQFGVWCLIILILLSLSYLTYQRNKDWKDGLTVWSTLAKNYPEDVISNYYTALEYERKGDFDKAIEYINIALQIQPRLHEAHFELGKIYEQLGQKKQAQDHYQKALEIYPGFAPAQESLEELISGKKKTPQEQEGWSEYLTKYGFSFSYPASWKLIKIDKGAHLTDETGLFNIQLQLIRLDYNGDMSQFLSEETSVHGQLINQGRAQVPDVVQSYVKIWQDKNSKLMQFFLLKDKKVVQVLVWPADSSKMSQFNRILGTVKMDIRQSIN